MKSALLFASIISIFSFEAFALKIYLVSNHDERKQVWGIVTAFETLSSKKVSLKDLNVKTLTASEIKDKIEKTLARERVIFIGVGEEGIAKAMDLPKDPNLIVCLTSPVLLEHYKNETLLKKVDFIALPTHVAADVKKELREKLIETRGVLHNRRPDMTTYDEYQKELPHADVYLGVYLHGDTPTHTKKMEYFTEEEAIRLADYIIAKAQEINLKGLKTCILILNNPRAAKQENNGKERLSVQQKGKSDLIIELFSKKLADEGIEYKIFDFSHTMPENEKGVRAYDAFDLVTGAIRTTKGKLIVSGDATSVISEAIDIMPFDAIDTMPPGKVLVYHHGAMNEEHRVHVKHEQEAGRVSILEDYENILPPPDAVEFKFQPTASKVIVQKLMEVASAQAPWMAEESVYRRMKQKEYLEKIKQNIVTQAKIKAGENLGFFPDPLESSDIL